MIPDNSRKKLEQLRQEAALRAQLQQQYDKDMKKVPLEQMIPFSQWMDKRPKPMAKGGSIKDLEEHVRKHEGQYGVKRMQRVFDEIPAIERMYDMEALKRALTGDNAQALMTMSPADFEKFALRLGSEDDESAYEGGMSRSDYLGKLAKIARTKGFNDVPFLEVGKRKPDYLPSIEGHEGRHRSRALAGMNVPKSLVRLMPTPKMRESMPRKYRDEFIEALKKELGENRLVTPEGRSLLPADLTAQEHRNLENRNLLAANRPQLPEIYAEGGAVNAFDYENPKHVENVATIASKHRDFKQIPDVVKHLAGALSQGNYKFIEDPRIQSAISKAGHSGYFISGKEGKQQIVRKATGGAINSIDQMQMELANKTRFKGLSQLQSIGAEEAPSLGVKAYVPPAGRPDNGQMPVGGIDTQQGDLPVGGIDMNNMQQGQQLAPNAPPAPAGQQQGMNQVPQGDKIPTMDGTGMPPNPNANPNQMGSNILKMTPQGQAMAAMKPQGLNKGGQPKVEVRPTVKDDAATRRTPEIETAIKALQAGIINQKEYDRIVQKHKPVKPYSFVPAPATDEQAMNVLIDRQKKSWRSHENWPAGHPVGLRLDIPAYERQGVWVNSIHDESGRKGESFPTSYGPVSAVRNATFEGSPSKAVRVATGEQTKTPFAKIMGELEHIDEKKAIAHMKKFLNHPEYRQIGYDPRRHGDFYDRETMQPVQSAEHVVQIGPLVLAKNPQYAKKRTEYAEGGDVEGEGELKKLSPEQRKEVAKQWAGQLHYEAAPPMSKQDIEKHADRMVAQITGVENPHGKTKQQIEREKNLTADIRYKKMKNIPNVDYSKLKNAFLVGVPGDPTIGGVIPVSKMKKRFSLQMPTAGATLHSIDNQALESPVPMYGGTRYGAYKGPNAWASDLGASRGLFNVVQRLHEEDPSRGIYGNTHRMSNESANHAIHMLDSAISYMRPHQRPKEHIDYLNNLIRNVRTSKNDIGDMKPHFVGFENPDDLMLQASMDAKLRKKILGVLGTNKHFPGGKQMIDDIYFVISHPELRNMEVGTAGHGVMKFDPTRKLEDEISQHPTYAHDIPSELIGQSRYPIPLQIAAPRSMQRSLAKAKQMGLKLAQPFNDMSRSIIREPIDEQYINQLGEYEMAMKKRLGYKSGGKVKLHTDQDTMRLALTKKSKKAK